MAQLVKNLPAMWETWVQSLGWEDPLEKGKVTHSSGPENSVAWRIPWTVSSCGHKESDATEQLSLSISPQGLYSARLLYLWHSVAKNTGVGCIFSSKGSLMLPALGGGFFTTSM